ncbi:MAG TPA: cytochrome c oxidase subunit 3 [Candidatus Polarisedimenticolia bacterium]|nr:cytochrome c oxidase subunit 3 [Candidatus Polarisedimenticolia bacterium]
MATEAPPDPRPARASAITSPIPNHRLVMLAFLGAEAMLFTGLLGATMVLRSGAPMWPPAGQPLLPIWAGSANLVLLAAGSAGMMRATRGVRSASHRRLVSGIGLTLISGAGFLAVLGIEWARLYREGLRTTTTGSYGPIFYTLTGCHALHALAVMIWVGILLVLALRDRFSPAHHEPVEMAAMFWHFVAVAWVFLFVVLYLL